MFTYTHHVAYYETDKMGITHHSNYIRFMEEARTAWMKHIGWSYKKCEDLGMPSPVVRVQCDYKKTTTYDDAIDIQVWLSGYSGVRMTVGYAMYRAGELVCDGQTEHCFLDDRGMPVRIKRQYPEFDAILRRELETQGEPPIVFKN